MNNGRAREEGFATITCVMLCAGLAVVSVALVDQGFQSASRARQEVDQEIARQALRSAIAETAAAHANRRTVSFGLSVWRQEDVEVHVETFNELRKANIYHAPEAEIESALQNLAGIDAVVIAARIVSARGELGAGSLPLAGFFDRLDIAPASRACIRERLTVHASSTDPFAMAPQGQASPEGGILNLRARVKGGGLMHEAIVVVTGNPREPLLVLEERVFRASQIAGCADEES
jgi:hypothetical protein